MFFLGAVAHVAQRMGDQSIAEAAFSKRRTLTASVLLEAPQLVASRVSANSIPLGWRRQVKVSLAAAKISASLIEAKLRGFMSQGAPEKQRRDQLIAASIALVAPELAKLRGTVQKIVQLGSAVLQGMPREIRDQLLNAEKSQPTMAVAEARAIFAHEVGGVAEEMIESWQTLPVGLGSIGQVYRVKLNSIPTDLALKIQYPDVAKAMAADLSLVKNVSWVVRALYPTLDTTGLLAALKKSAQVETNFAIEAQNNQDMRQALATEVDIIIPKVHSQITTRRVLATDFVEGMTLDKFRENSRQVDRNRVGEQLCRSFLFALASGLFRQDLFPGNYIVSGNSLAIVDLALIRRPSYEENFLFAVSSVMDDDLAGFKDYLIRNSWVTNPADFDFEAIFKTHRDLYLKPFCTSSFAFTSEFCRDVFQHQIRSRTTTQGMRLPPKTSYVIRFYWTLYSQLAALEAACDWQAIARKAVARFHELENKRSA
jgi:predicted unusual protein kinase regulating ubiquinone biosynthesis (AarF/ABC1/UbiB family)